MKTVSTKRQVIVVEVIYSDPLFPPTAKELQDAISDTRLDTIEVKEVIGTKWLVYFFWQGFKIITASSFLYLWWAFLLYIGMQAFNIVLLTYWQTFGVVVIIRYFRGLILDKGWHTKIEK